jgi:hypothetical protein
VSGVVLASLFPLVDASWVDGEGLSQATSKARSSAVRMARTLARFPRESAGIPWLSRRRDHLHNSRDERDRFNKSRDDAVR